MAKQLRHEDYTVGWVCALPDERAAAEEMFDEEHADLDNIGADNDENSYSLGSICGHNVVIVCLPAGQIGTNLAASVATQMRATFKQLRFSLMVGIGGGVPTAKDIRLGDVVVSQPQGTHPGVVQYDMGKSTIDGFRRTGALIPPPKLLLSAITKLQSNESRGRSKRNEYIARVEAVSTGHFQRSKAAPDILMQKAHQNEEGVWVDRRKVRSAAEQVVAHYGTIASGNSVIKNAAVRDKISEALDGVLCFEMEAAGLVSNFPCLVVRGVCDYADSYKNDSWQPYAAATAAAYAKELLSFIPAKDVAKTPTVDETMRNASVKPIYYIPFLRNLQFVGRLDELSELRQRLLVDQNCRKMSVVGLGGTGKTQVVLQFAYMVKEMQPERSVLWMPAVSMESFDKACLDIAEALGIPEAAVKEGDPKELVRQRLSSHQAGPWLLIVDNADDRDILIGTRKGIVDYLPESEKGIVVYTTRTLEVAVSLTRGNALQLGAMNPQEAKEFLSKSVITKQLLSNGKAMRDLLNELTYLPLAIAQAAAYLNMNQISVEKYLSLLHGTEQNLVELMSEEIRDDTRYADSANAIATTWIVSFNQLRERDTVAADLLAIMSCIEWKSIPQSLLPKAQSDVRMEKAIGALCGYSFLVRRGNNHAQDGATNTVTDELFDMHRLVHLATQIWIKKYADPTQVTSSATEHVEQVFPEVDWHHRQIWRAYLPHTIRLLGLERDSNAKHPSELFRLAALCLGEDGRTKEAISWLERSVQLRNKYSKDGSDRPIHQHALAMAYTKDGQTRKAIELLKVVVKVKGTLDADDPSRLVSQFGLAAVYLDDGQVIKATELLEALVKAEEALDTDDPIRLASQRVLAKAYLANGQIRKAIQLLEAVVKAEETLDVDDPLRLASQHALADVYHADGQITRAIDLLERTIEIGGHAQGLDHPLLLSMQYSLALAYDEAGQLQRAIELLETVVDIRTRTLRPDHPDRLISVEALAKMRANLAAETSSVPSSTSSESAQLSPKEATDLPPDSKPDDEQAVWESFTKAMLL